MNSRLEKLENVPGEKYPRDFPGRVPIKIVLESFNFDKDVKDSGLDKHQSYIPPGSYKIAGRVSARRDHGNNIFFDLFDQTGSIQIHAKMDLYSDDAYESKINKTEWIWNKIQECDLGDCVGAEGTLSQNPRGEPLLLISNWTLLAKALIEPADKHNGLTNPEVKYRHRERDLLSSADSRALFKTRAEIVFEIRKYLNEREFIEIETPILQPIYGGATARPFITKHNALSQQFYLAISSELYLKRALVGGFDRVYAFSRCFRNEGISPEHNPEFTNLEIFETCKTAEDMQIFTENLLEYIAHSVGSLVPPMRFDRFLPASDWPLSRTIDMRNKESDAWELYIDGMEIASGASDLNDPREQEARLKESEKKAGPDVYNQTVNNIDYDPYDKNYIEALECGALPWAGVGIGIDRLVMLLCDKTNIRDCILFPTLRSLADD